MGDAVLEVEDLSISFGGVQALSGAHLRACPGRVTALIGPNGAGKSTLVNCVTGHARPDRGRIVLDGEDLLGSSPTTIVSHGVFRTFQEVGLFEHLDGLQNVLVGRRMREQAGVLSCGLRLPSARREEAANASLCLDILDRMGLADWARRGVDEMPYGIRKQLEVARAVASEARVVILDEPAGGLGPVEVDALAEQIRWLCREHGVAMVLIEHNVTLVSDLADTVYVLDFGVPIANGPPAAVLADPSVRAAYLGGTHDDHIRSGTGEEDDR